MLTLEEVKLYLRISDNGEDVLLQSLIKAAESYLYNATGNTFDNTNELAKLFCLVLISDWYENREYVGKASEKVRFTLESVLVQLKYCHTE